MEPGETPEQGARRELKEETGLTPESLTFHRTVQGNDVILHCFTALCFGTPSSHLDPDQEVSKWEWIDIGDGIPVKIWDNLHGPKGDENVVRQMFEAEDLHKAEPGVWWHGTPSGELVGSHYGLHVGTQEAARQALTAKIGHPVEGSWDGTRTHKDTLLAGQNTLKARGIFPTGYNCRAPDFDFYSHQHPEGAPTFSDGTPILDHHKPDIFPVEITGPMTNRPHTPHEDFRANGYMKAAVKKGNPKRGYYYRNVGEDSGSISAVVPPGGAHLRRLDRSLSKAESKPKTPKIPKPPELVVTHNLSEDKLKHASEIGGLIAPSIAIHHKEYGHDGFGEISLIAPPHVVDPKTTPVFDADIYSPRHPRVFHSLKPKEAKEFLTWIRPHQKEVSKHYASFDSFGIHFNSDQISKGFEDGLRHSFLSEKAPEVLSKIKESAKPTTIGTYEYDTDWGAIRYGIRQHIEDSGLKPEYEKYAKEKIAPILGDRYFLKNGKKKPYTTENVLKELTSTIRNGEGGMSGGMGQIRAAGAKKFRSFDQLKGHQDKLGRYGDSNFPSEIVSGDGRQVKSVKSANSKNFEDISDALKTANDSGFSTWGSLDQTSDVIKHLYKTKNIDSALRAGGFNPEKVSAETKAKIRQLAADLVMSPTEYFEAKPQRVVGINEFKAAAIPHNASPDVVGLLNRHGIRHIERYQKDDPIDRKRAVQRAAEANDLMLSEDDFWEALEFEELKKSRDSEVQSLLRHPDPVERSLALKLDSCSSHDILEASLDPHPDVWAEALNHPEAKHARSVLLASARAHDGTDLWDRHLHILSNPDLPAAHVHKLYDTVLGDNSLEPDIRASRLYQISRHPSFGDVEIPEDLHKAEYLLPDLHGDVNEPTRPELEPLKAAFGTAKTDRTPSSKQITKTGVESGKKVVNITTPDGPQRLLLKPYKTLYNTGWQELNSQALYHAAGIGDLHQKSFVTHYEGEPHVAVLIEPGHTAGSMNDLMPGPKTRADASVRKAYAWDLIKPHLGDVSKIHVMDYIQDNIDRHDENLLIRPDGRPLAIDNSGSEILWDQPHHGFEYFSRNQGNSLTDGRLDDHIDTIKSWWPQVGPKIRRALSDRLRDLPEDRRNSVIKHFGVRLNHLDDIASGKLQKAIKGADHLKGPAAAVSDALEDKQYKTTKAISPLDLSYFAGQAKLAENRNHRIESFEELNTAPHDIQPESHTLDGIEPKTVYRNPQTQSRHMVKSAHSPFLMGVFRQIPTFEDSEGFKQNKDYFYEANLNSGWSEATTQELYKAGGISGLCQSSHIADVGGKPALVIHMAHHSYEPIADVPATAINSSVGNPEGAEAFRRIGWMDRLTFNSDRHAGNLMLSRSGGRPLAIDHGRSFYVPHRATHDGTKTEDVGPFRASKSEAEKWGRHSAQVLGDNSRGYPDKFWWDSTKDAMKARFHEIVDATAGEHRDTYISHFDHNLSLMDAEIQAHYAKEKEKAEAYARAKPQRDAENDALFAELNKSDSGTAMAQNLARLISGRTRSVENKQAYDILSDPKHTDEVIEAIKSRPALATDILDLGAEVGGYRDLLKRMPDPVVNAVADHIDKDHPNSSVFLYQMARQGVLSRLTPDVLSRYISHPKAGPEMMSAVNGAKNSGFDGSKVSEKDWENYLKSPTTTGSPNNASKVYRLRVLHELGGNVSDSAISNVVAEINQDLGPSARQNIYNNIAAYSRIPDSVWPEMVENAPGALLQNPRHQNNTPEQDAAILRSAVVKRQSTEIDENDALRYPHGEIKGRIERAFLNSSHLFGQEEKANLNQLFRMHRLDPDTFKHPDLSTQDDIRLRGGKKHGAIDVRTNTMRLRRLRDHILQTGKTELSPKHFTPDLKPLLEQIPFARTKSGDISADLIQKAIDSTPSTKFNWGTSEWDGVQRHSVDPSHVFQLDVSTDHIKKMHEAGVLDSFWKRQKISETHPINTHTVGWVRYTGRLPIPAYHDPGSIFIDEIQSDHAVPYVKQIESETRREYPDDPAAVAYAVDRAQKHLPLEHQKKINEIIFGSVHPNKVVAEAFLQHLRNLGDGNTSIRTHTVESKLPISFSHKDDSDRPTPQTAPVHFKDTYEKMPKEWGMKPATYGDSPRIHNTETGPEMKGKPIQAGVVRKTEDVE
jgi:hypothetical protein